jgi:hypothetical protein
VQFADGQTFPVGGRHALVHKETGVIYLAIPLCNVGTGLAVLRGYRLQGETASDVTQDPRGVAQHRRGDLAPPAAVLLAAAAGPADQRKPGRFLAGALRDPATPLYKEIALAVDTGGRMTVDVMYGDHAGGQPSVTRFVMLPEAGSWRCDATRYWSLQTSSELRDFGFT